jgi:hypothetical protein
VGADNLFEGKAGLIAEQWNGTKWSIQEPPIPTGAQENAVDLQGVSCTSATACTAVGAFVNRAKNVWVGYTEQWDGTTWVAQELPSPAGAGNIGMSGISCTSPTSCLVVGTQSSAHMASVPLAESWNGTTWTVQEPPLPPNAKETYLKAVSCTTTEACTAVGYYYDTAGEDLPLAERWNGTTWTVQEPPAPSATATQPFVYLQLSGVSCVSATSCTAVGNFYNASKETLPFAESWNGTTWTAAELPLPHGLHELWALSGVSCTAPTACTAVGYGVESVAESWNGVAWSAEVLPEVEETRALVDAVSCTTTPTCVAVGYFSEQQNFVQTRYPLAEITPAREEAHKVTKKEKEAAELKTHEEEAAAAAKKQEEEAATKKQEEVRVAAAAAKNQEETAAAAAKKKQEEEAAAKKTQEEQAAAAAAKKKQEEEAAAKAAAKKKQEEAAKKSKPLTRTQKLTRALKQCKKQSKKKRAACEAKAKKQYGPVKKKK